MDKITAAAVDEWVRIRRDEHEQSTSTIAKNLGALRALFNLAVKKDVGVTRTPFVGRKRIEVPVPTQRRFGHLTRAQVASVLERIRGQADRYRTAEWDADLIEFTFGTGLRLSELARLQVQDADVFGNRLRVAGKNEPRFLAMPGHLRPVLARLRGGAGEAGPLLGTVARIRQAFQRWQSRLGVPALHPHGIRHSCATALVDTGAPIFTIQAILGHKTPQMTSRYYHGQDAAAKRALEAIALTTPPAEAGSGTEG
jgi:integrase